MTTLLLRGGTIHTPAGDATATALAAEDGRVVYVGGDDGAAAYDGADVVVDLHGALAAPAFTDAHVHSVLTGFQLTRVDLRGTATLTEALDLVARQARVQPDGVVVATGWEEHSWPEGRPPTAAEIERAAPGRLVLLERRDCHSSVISPALEQAVPGLPGIDGYDPSGRVDRDARQAVSEKLGELIGPEQRLVAARAATQAMAASGIAGFHEAAAPHIGPAYELELVRHAAAREGLHPTFYWGSRDFDAARELGVAGLAGDLNADGAIGSRTAALSHDYDDQPGNRGHALVTPEDIADHLVACTRAGLQGGFHCIGEAALETVAEGLVLAEKQLGRDALRAARHRLEHVEMPPRRLLELMADLGVVASMQPLFDDLWGGPDLMYAERLGERWRGMNPVGSMGRLGVLMAFGSDSPVSPINPWAGVRAAAQHRDPEERLDARAAFSAHTRGGWYAARVDDAGVLAPGQAAHVAVWDCPAGLVGDLPDLEPGLPLPALRHLFVDGVLSGEDR
ncbi:MAG TPA: amidohydrolase family protein [Marmoricola sp.]|nr:amidohydrolase family protein [Marmoricola sp.]